MPSVDVGSASLFYEEKGTGDPLVFVHGIPTDYRAWSAQVGPLSGKFRTLSLSRRYASPNTREGDVMDSTIQNNALDIKGFVEKLGIAPVNLVGHSIGGFASAYLAADHPDLVKSLTLVEPAVSTLLVANQKSSAQVLGLLLRSPSVALSARRFQSGSLNPSLKALAAGDNQKAVELNVDGVQDWKGAYAKMPDDVRKMMLDNARTIAELKTDFPRFTATEVGKVSCRTLVINGASSVLWLRKIGELVAQAVPNARRGLIAGARHFPHMEKAGAFNDQLLAFLGDSR